ncbi:MAG: tripartite tricarboxylate transporter substrate-binding protein [Xanthobacteraceae bacterium]|jgi:tripartite-type tricarboxylate transporter receptor subunit TctC
MLNKWIVAIVATALAAVGVARASNWPTRPITMVVPFAAGGPTDVVGRILAERLGDVLKRQVIVVNVGGAGGMTGAERVAQAKPDGYEVLLGTVGTQAYSQTLYKKPLYSATRDFAPVVLVAEQPLVLVVRKDFPASSLKEFAAYAKANAAKLSFGSGGAGSATHLGCVLLNTKLGIKVQHVPYRGSAPALQDLMAGRIDYLCDAVSTELSPIKAASVRPIAMLTMRRTAVLPDVPTAKEQGFAVDANNWIGLFFPRGTPDPIIHHLRDATVAAMNTPALRARMETIGTDLVAADRTSSSYLQHYVASEIKKWATPIKESGVTVD